MEFSEISKIARLNGLKVIYLEKNPLCLTTKTYEARLRHIFPQLIQIDAESLTEL